MEEMKNETSLEIDVAENIYLNKRIERLLNCFDDTTKKELLDFWKNIKEIIYKGLWKYKWYYRKR